jgi:anthranilate/para-aminobenzoate synthase component II
MSIIIVDNESTYTNALLKLLSHQNPTLINYKDLNYRNLSTGDIVILTGGHGVPILWHKKHYTNEVELIKKHKGPIIGICLGFELIAHTYGSHLRRLGERRKGEITITPSKKSLLVIPSSVMVHESHNWSVPKVKRPLRALAYSDDGVEIFKHSRKPIYGVQFHPEASSTAGKRLFTDILDYVSAL